MKPKDLVLKANRIKKQAAIKVSESWVLFIATLAAYLIFKNVDYSMKMREADRTAERAAERAAERVVEKLMQREEKKMQETLNRIEGQEN